MSKQLKMQLAAFIAQNPFLANFVNGKIHRGAAKQVCTPGLNCFSCPGAAFACPMGSAQAFFAAGGSGLGKIGFYIIGFLLLVGMLFGRFICGYICPMGLIQDLIHKIPIKKLKLKLRWARYIKYVVLVLFVVVFPMLFLHELSGNGDPWFCKYICPSGTIFAAVPLMATNDALRDMASWLFTWKVFVTFALLVTSAFIYRYFCRVLCPLGAVYSLFNKVAVMKMHCDKSKCRSAHSANCSACAKVCPLGINPMEQPNSPECMRCGVCIRKCSAGALYNTAFEVKIQIPQ